MQITCNDRERVFREGNAEDWAALELHAKSCADCAEEVRAWKALSLAAEELRDYRESPGQWPRIEAALTEQRKQGELRAPWVERLAIWRNLPIGWQTAMAGALVLLMTATAGYVYLRSSRINDDHNNPFLKDRALAEVERTERDYMKAIDKLASQANPQLETASSPIMADYREKLLLLDSAIDELRLQAGQNPSNAHLRYQLLAMYQEKQATLQEVLETKQ
jgi:hypothetical protein